VMEPAMTLRERLARAICEAQYGHDPDGMVSGNVPSGLEEDDPLTKALIDADAVKHPRWMDYVYIADAVLAEIAAAGMVLVPREPTEQMWWMGMEMDGHQGADVKAIYRAMISSAVVHASDCAVHNEPAYPAGPCNCGAMLSAAPSGGE